jgi:hypothetical protein
MNKQEQSPSPENEEIELTEDATLASILVDHIENPCSDEKGNNLRLFWLKTAKELLELNAIENKSAKKMVEDAIKKYSKK